MALWFLTNIPIQLHNKLYWQDGEKPLPELNLLTWFALELSFPVSQAGAAHHVAILSLAVPFLSDPIVMAIIMTPLCLMDRTYVRKEQWSGSDYTVLHNTQNL